MVQRDFVQEKVQGPWVLVGAQFSSRLDWNSLKILAFMAKNPNWGAETSENHLLMTPCNKYSWQNIDQIQWNFHILVQIFTLKNRRSVSKRRPLSNRRPSTRRFEKWTAMAFYSNIYGNLKKSLKKRFCNKYSWQNIDQIQWNFHILDQTLTLKNRRSLLKRRPLSNRRPSERGFEKWTVMAFYSNIYGTLICKDRVTYFIVF